VFRFYPNRTAFRSSLLSQILRAAPRKNQQHSKKWRTAVNSLNASGRFGHHRSRFVMIRGFMRSIVHAVGVAIR